MGDWIGFGIDFLFGVAGRTSERKKLEAREEAFTGWESVIKKASAILGVAEESNKGKCTKAGRETNLPIKEGTIADPAHVSHENQISIFLYYIFGGIGGIGTELI